MAVQRIIACLSFIFLCLEVAQGFHIGSQCVHHAPAKYFKCLYNTNCIPLGYVCDGNHQCPRGEDEWSCVQKCPDGSLRCPRSNKCVIRWKICDGVDDCGDNFDEGCDGYREFSTIRSITHLVTSEDHDKAKRKLVQWFLGRKKSDRASLELWGSDLPRTATAIFMADSGFFAAGNATGEGIRYELANGLLARLDGNIFIGTQELALYINALQAACVDPSDFYGRDLLVQLRELLDTSGAPPDPFSTLVLCNAGGTVSENDVKRVLAAHDAKYRPFWVDIQALSVMALHCLSSQVDVDEGRLNDMIEELKRRQFGNGTIDNLRTTALVVQALTATNSLDDDFNVEAAMKILVDAQTKDGNIGSELVSYYAAAALGNTSLLNISRSHCGPRKMSGPETLVGLMRHGKGGIKVSHSVWMGHDVDMGRTWRLRVPMNSSCYEVLENVNAIDVRHRVRYDMVNGKPFVTSAFETEDDPEKGLYWFTYIKTKDNDKAPVLFHESPADIVLGEGEELILWYKAAKWENIPSENTTVA